MKDYLVSLVLIVYNTEAYLDECLDSVFAQTLKEVELVVVNNDSNDATNAILEKRVVHRENVVYIREGNVGGATAGNAGIRAASGKYVYLMDSDDILPPDALEKLCRRAEETGCDIAMGKPLDIIEGVLRTHRDKYDRLSWAEEKEIEDIRKAPHLTISPFYWGRVYRREFLLQNGIFMIDGSINADRYFTTKALKCSKKTAVINEVCYIWRRREKSLPHAEKSITQRRGEVDFFLDRIRSLYAVADLFDEPGYEEMREYVRMKNIQRLFIPITEIVENKELYPVFLREARQYLSKIDPDRIYGDNVLRAKVKVYAYLLINNRDEDLVNMLQHLTEFEKVTLDGKDFIQYGVLKNIPMAVCWEGASGPALNALTGISKEKGKIVFNARIEGWKGYPCKLLRVYCMRNRLVEDFTVRSLECRQQEGQNRTIAEYSFGIAKNDFFLILKENNSFYLELEYIADGFVYRSRLDFGLEKTGRLNINLLYGMTAKANDKKEAKISKYLRTAGRIVHRFKK
jgi:glycosyltransferase involved in cell wall biosynthesis